MAFIPLASCAKVSVEMTLQSETIVNTLYFREDEDSISSSNMLDLLNAVETWWDTSIKPLVPTNVLLDRIRAVETSQENGIAVEINPNISGTNSGIPLPSQNTFAITFVTGYAGRSFRGRNYFPVLTEGDVTNNTVDGDHLAAIIDAYEQIPVVVGADAPNWAHVVASFYTNNAPREDGIATLVNGYSYSSNRVKTQRRRNNGR